MNCVILYRVNGGKLGCVETADGQNLEWRIYEFPHMDAAVEYVENNPLFRDIVVDGKFTRLADYQIVELDEL